MDELPEFSRNVLESLRQPIESKNITIARVNNHATYPANFQLIAAMNSCKYGFLVVSVVLALKCPDVLKNTKTEFLALFLIGLICKLKYQK
ncbi:MAG: hypothetical protein IRD7MM_05990 [Candidatus Midichloria mitochondrii]